VLGQPGLSGIEVGELLREALDCPFYEAPLQG